MADATASPTSTPAFAVVRPRVDKELAYNASSEACLEGIRLTRAKCAAAIAAASIDALGAGAMPMPAYGSPSALKETTASYTAVSTMAASRDCRTPLDVAVLSA